MGPKKANESVKKRKEKKRKKEKKEKKRRKKEKKKWATIEVKKEIIQKHENDTCVWDLALQFSLTKSLICTILKNKEAIKDANVAKGLTVIKKRSLTLEVEKLLLIWTNEKKLADNSISEAIISEKVKLVLYLSSLCVRLNYINWF